MNARQLSDGGDAQRDEGIFPYSVFAVQAARVSALLLAVALMLPRAFSVVGSFRMGDGVELPQLKTSLMELGIVLMVPVLVSVTVGLTISLVQSRFSNQWGVESKSMRAQEFSFGTWSFFLSVLGAIGIGCWSFQYWIGRVNGCLGLEGGMRDLVVGLRVWLVLLGVGCGALAVVALAFARLFPRRA